MSVDNPNYKMIEQAWERERKESDLNDLEDPQLTEMSSYLSQVRRKLAETPSEKELEAELLKQEALNLEFMLKDILHLRRNKILSTVLNGTTPAGIMTLSEEEYYNRLSRAFESHHDFVEETLSGSLTPIPKKEGRKSDPPKETKKKKETNPDEIEYVVVRFVKSIDTEFVGLDEIVYGPFQKEDIAKIPMANARMWVRDGTVVQVVPEDLGVSNEDE